MYLEGKGVTQNFTKALELFYQSAAQEEPYAELNLGLVYKESKCVLKDYAQAKKWFLKACEHGEAFGCILYNQIEKL